MKPNNLLSVQRLAMQIGFLLETDLLAVGDEPGSPAASSRTTERYSHLAPGHLQDAVRGLSL